MIFVSAICLQLSVIAAHDDALQPEIRAFQPFDDFYRCFRTITSEHDKCRRQIRIKTESFAFRPAIPWF
jgi:hypothetical protein